MENNACLGCRFGSVQIDVDVPEEYDLKKLAEQKREFTADLSAATKQKPIHYSVHFDPQETTQKPNFNVNCSCILNVHKSDCSKFNLAVGRTLRIKHFEPKKPSARRQKIELIKTI